MGGGVGGARAAPLIKISWVAVPDPQYAVIVSPQLHKKPQRWGNKRDERIYKLSHSCQEVAGFAHWLFLWFFFSLVDREAPIWPSSQGLWVFFCPTVISATLTVQFNHVLFFLRKKCERKRKYMNLRSLQMSDMKSVTLSKEQPLCKVYLKCGRGKAWRSLLQKECVVNATLMAKLVRPRAGSSLWGGFYCKAQQTHFPSGQKSFTTSVLANRQNGIFI